MRATNSQIQTMDKTSSYSSFPKKKLLACEVPAVPPVGRGGELGDGADGRRDGVWAGQFAPLHEFLETEGRPEVYARLPVVGGEHLADSTHGAPKRLWHLQQ